MKKLFLMAMMIAMTAYCGAQSLESRNYTYTPQEWKQIVRKSPDSFFATDEAKRIADNVLAYQRITGGWPKNIAMHRPLGGEIELVLADKKKCNDSTTDNDATILEMTYLARMYQQVGEEKYRTAFVHGVDFLLNGQYKNGGWPQFWPENRTYQVHITYNDNAMVQTMRLIRDLRDGKTPFDNLVNDKMKKRLSCSFDNGIKCILNTQIVVNGEPTVWCQQHDHITLKPARARAYELASYCSAESSSLVELLMEIPNPDKRIIVAVNGAMRWFEAHKLTGIRVERFVDANGQRDTRVVNDANAQPIWARMYDLEKAEPLFCDRDGVPRKTLAEVGYERRNGYSWYNQSPASLTKDYNAWKNKNKITLQ
jgi:PelA/Pel-15E family pectate lyase